MHYPPMINYEEELTEKYCMINIYLIAENLNYLKMFYYLTKYHLNEEL